MIRRYVNRRNLILLTLALMAMILASCGPETLVVGLEPTPTPQPTPTPVLQSYANDQYGFAFRYPETWSLIEQPHLVRLRRGDQTLSIAYGWLANPQFQPMGGLTGTSAGDLLYRGKLSFLGKEIPVHVLSREIADKMIDNMVTYGDSSLVRAGDLAFSIWLARLAGASEEDQGIPDDVQAESQEILNSFKWIEAVCSPPVPTATPVPSPTREPIPGADKGLTTYVNDEYQVAFIYPPSWNLAEASDIPDTSDGASGSAISLTWEDYHLAAQFWHDGETILPGPSNDPDCAIQEAGTVTVLGREVGKQVQVCGGRITALFMSEQFDDLGLSFQQTSGAVGEIESEDVGISETAQLAFDSVLGSLHRTGEAKMAGPDALTYENDQAGFSFHYPASWTVTDVPGEIMEGGLKLADAVTIKQGEFGIVVQYRRKSDTSPMAWGGSVVPGGMGYAEAMLGQQVTVLSEDTHQYVWTYGGDTKAIAVNTTGERADLVLSITLSDATVRIVNERAATLSDGAIAALDQVLGTFALIK